MKKDWSKNIPFKNKVGTLYIKGCALQKQRVIMCEIPFLKALPIHTFASCQRFATTKFKQTNYECLHMWYWIIRFLDYLYCQNITFLVPTSWSNLLYFTKLFDPRIPRKQNRMRDKSYRPVQPSPNPKEMIWTRPREKLILQLHATTTTNIGKLAPPQNKQTTAWTKNDNNRNEGVEQQ